MIVSQKKSFLTTNTQEITSENGSVSKAKKSAISDLA